MKKRTKKQQENYEKGKYRVLQIVLGLILLVIGGYLSYFGFTFTDDGKIETTVYPEDPEIKKIVYHEENKEKQIISGLINMFLGIYIAYRGLCHIFGGFDDE